MHSPLRAIRRLILFVLWAAAIAPAQWVLLKLNRKHWLALPKRFHRVTCRILGLQVQVRGRLSRRKPTLYVCNHMSYLDIPVLGGVLDGSFVAKSEVDTWPAFGWLARLQKTVFINRKQGSTADQRDSLLGRLEAGDNLILFPEGTSGDGNRLLPFKSALFAVANLEVDGEPITIQPISLSVTHLDGIPLGRWLRPYYAWYGDMPLAGHVYELAGLGRLRVVVQAHPPLTIKEFTSRKALAQAAWQTVAAGVEAANNGRPLKLPRVRRRLLGRRRTA
ncbi:MAG: lysophospholipid acyltransferase family protein [Azospirillaceae bacterium]